MCRRGNTILRYIFAYFLYLLCLLALFPTEVYGYTTAHHSDPDTYRQQEQPAETHTKVRGVTSAYKGDVSSRHQQRNPTKSHTGSSGDSLALNSQTDINSHYQKPAKSNAEIHEGAIAPNGKPDTNPRKQKHTGSNRDTLANHSQTDINSHYQKPAKSNADIHEDTIAPNGKTATEKNPRKQKPAESHTFANNRQSDINSHIQNAEKGSAKTHGDILVPNGESDTNPRQQKPTKSHTATNGETLDLNSSRIQKSAKGGTKIHGDMLAPNGESDTNAQKQKATKTNTDDDTLSLNAERDPHSQQKEQPIKIRTKSYQTSTSVSRRRAKRLKTRSLTLPGEISLSDIPVLEVSTSAPLVSPSSTISNRTLPDVFTRAASNGSGVTRETVPANFTAISVVPSEEAFPKELPLPLLIASPVAAVSIIIFVCVAYCCHSNQLDARARQLALKYAVISTEPPACSRGIPSTSSVDMDLIRKTSLRPSTSRTSTPNPTPNGSKRGSMNWVAIGDQEVITYTAARRHSTFIL